jgi:hypothetical protein
MANRSQDGYWNLKKFAASLRSLTECLPTENEKITLRGHFQEIISFLSQTQKALDTLPTTEETAGARKAIEAFEELSTKAKSNSILSAALGLNAPRAPRPKPLGLTRDEDERAQALLNELRALSIDDMNARLNNDRVIGARDLEAVAFLVGIKPKRKAAREILAQQIVTKISNYRGYQELQGGPR